MLGLKLIYIANVIVAGWIGVTSLFFPHTAIRTIFSNAYELTETVRLVGALWLAIAVLSLFGIWKPITFSPILVFQLTYKGGWLLIVGLPALMNGSKYPREMALFFLIWVIVLPFIIPWKELMN